MIDVREFAIHVADFINRDVKHEIVDSFMRKRYDADSVAVVSSQEYKSDDMDAMQMLENIKARLRGNLKGVLGTGQPFCCDFMKGQLTPTCEQHGTDCPDNVIQKDFAGRLLLQAENASYGFQFCPMCGSKIPDEVNAEINELDPERLANYMGGGEY
jgi:hypothetical protein